MRWSHLAAVALTCGFSVVASACSGVALFGDGTVVVGGNENTILHNPSMWAAAASEDAYGAVFFGLWFRNLGDRLPGWYEMQGMNDQGLYFDLFGTPCPPGGGVPTERPFWWKPEPLEKVMLQKCATAEEGLAFLSARGYHSSVPCTQVLLVDRFGAAVVYSATGLVWRDPTSSSFAATNFDLATPELGEWPCDRYDAIQRLVAADSEPTVDRASAILSVVAAGALYSVVCDLVAGTVDVYQSSDFSTRARLDTSALFSAGLDVTPLASLDYAPSGLFLPTPLRLDSHGP